MWDWWGRGTCKPLLCLLALSASVQSSDNSSVHSSTTYCVGKPVLTLSVSLKFSFSTTGAEVVGQVLAANSVATSGFIYLPWGTDPVYLRASVYCVNVRVEWFRAGTQRVGLVPLDS